MALSKDVSEVILHLTIHFSDMRCYNRWHIQHGDCLKRDLNEPGAPLFFLKALSFFFRKKKDKKKRQEGMGDGGEDLQQRTTGSNRTPVYAAMSRS